MSLAGDDTMSDRLRIDMSDPDFGTMLGGLRSIS